MLVLCVFCRIITSQPKTVQQLLTLLFGTWFRMIYHTEVNAMSVEAVAKSVAGSIFPSCTFSPEKVCLLCIFFFELTKNLCFSIFNFYLLCVLNFTLIKVERASKVMEVLIVGFASTELFGRELIEYFQGDQNQYFKGGEVQVRIPLSKKCPQ